MKNFPSKVQDYFLGYFQILLDVPADSTDPREPAGSY
jgi:hypothetical protein